MNNTDTLIGDKSIAMEYNRQITDSKSLQAALKKASFRFSMLRFGLFILAVIVLFQIEKVEAYQLITSEFVLLGLFILLFKKHQNIKYQLNLAQTTEAYWAHELDLLNYNFANKNDGSIYVDANHAYSYDLDLFGQHSLWTLINRCGTEPGRHYLANALLCSPVSLSLVKKRQEAIEELASLPNLRKNLGVYATMSQLDSDTLSRIRYWLTQPNQLITLKWWPIVRVVGPILLVGLALFCYFSGLSFGIWGVLGTPFWLLLAKHFAYSSQTITQVEASAKTLQALSLFFNEVEQAQLKSPLLKGFQTTLTEKGRASEQGRILAKRIDQMNLRSNMFSIPFQLFLLWDLQWLASLEAWRASYKSHFNEWINVLVDLEMLCSLAGLTHNNPNWVMPELLTFEAEHNLEALEHIKQGTPDELSQQLQVEETGHLMTFSQLGHPLLPPNTRVCNDYTIPYNPGHLSIITGSNMGGKSTFLRTVGLNLVLAGIGAPVCATQFKTALLSVHTSMRTTDTLATATSSFYAELKRIKTILEAIGNNPRTFVILDEVLKGTNYRDQHVGIKALIKQMLSLNAHGLFATHDLNLGELAQQNPKQITNICFEVETHNNELAFDYKLKYGLTQSFNACQLMRNIGIEIDDELTVTE